MPGASHIGRRRLDHHHDALIGPLRPPASARSSNDLARRPSQAMRDVVAALDESNGLQVHRAWWVARDAVQSWHREGRSVTLVLTNGLRVPVARYRLATLRERGWLDAGEAVRGT